MTTVEVDHYLKQVTRAYQNKGGLKKQRDPLKTTTAIRIRKTMISDLTKGAVLPPIVVGIVFGEELFKKFKFEVTNRLLIDTLMHLSDESVSIIDGMQRTTALLEILEAAENNRVKLELINKKKIRVEYWIATDVNSLIYRMLVLNSGQVPWNIRRQIEVVFQSMITEINVNVHGIELIDVDDKVREKKAGQYKSNDVVELFLVFGARKEKVDTKERLADEFTRLDFIENSASADFTSMFYRALDYLVKLDKLFDKFKNTNVSGEDQLFNNGRFSDGKDLFRSQPARIGFITAYAIEVLGRPGVERNELAQKSKFEKVNFRLDNIIKQLEAMDSSSIGNYLDYPTLSELVSNKSGKVGDFEREFFLKSFQVFMDDSFDNASMTPCWRAY